LGAELVVPVERLVLLWSLLGGSTIGGFTVSFVVYSGEQSVILQPIWALVSQVLCPITTSNYALVRECV
jgi:hypothetical protein